jgi:hypothetical protein
MSEVLYGSMLPLRNKAGAKEVIFLLEPLRRGLGRHVARGRVAFMVQAVPDVAWGFWYGAVS